MAIRLGEFLEDFNLFDNINLEDTLQGVMDDGGLKKANVFF